jgi:hypothetical protein
MITSYSKASIKDFLRDVNLAHKWPSPILRRLAQLPVQTREGPAAVSAGPRFFDVLSGLLRRPQRILLLWNWKAACLSIMLRAPIFLGVTIRRGFRVSASAILVECVYCAITAGFYGAIVQSLLDAEPQWLTLLFLTIVIPSIFQVFEFLLHRLHGTPHLKLAEFISIGVSAVSALFNWYAMRRGTLLVGGKGVSFGSDLRRLPRLIFNFVTSGPRTWGNRGKIT